MLACYQTFDRSRRRPLPLLALTIAIALTFAGGAWNAPTAQADATLRSDGAVASAVSATGAVGAFRRAAVEEAQAVDSVTLDGWLAVRARGEGAAGGDRLTVATVDGSFEVDLGAQVVVRDEGGRPIPSDELREGSQLRIRGLVRADARVEADEVDVRPLPPANGESTFSVRGRVLATVSAEAPDGEHLVVVATAEGDARIFVDTAAIVVDVAGASATVAEVRVGQRIEIKGSGANLLGLRAVRVTILPPERPVRLQVSGRLLARGTVEGGEGAERWVVGRAMVHASAAVAAEATVASGLRVDVRAERDGNGEMRVLSVVASSQLEENVELRGIVTGMSAVAIDVDDRTLEIDAQTQMEGQVRIGAYVRVRARVEAGGDWIAEQVEAQAAGVIEVQFEGAIEGLGLMQWQVAGVDVRIDVLATAISGVTPALGLNAEVTGNLEADGSVTATRIQVEGGVQGATLVVDGNLLQVGPVPGTWRLETFPMEGARVVLELAVTTETVVDESRGAVSLGAEAQIHVRLGAGGELQAEIIRIRREDR